MGRHNRRHIKIRPSGKTEKSKMKIPAAREITISQLPPRGPQALENQCVGLLKETRDGGVVVPDPGYPASSYGHIIIRKNQMNGAPFGMKVVCEILNPSAKRAEYEGRIVEVLGDPGNNDVEMLAILRQYGLSPVFPAAVMDEASRLPLSPTEKDIEEALLHGRKDLTTRWAYISRMFPST